MWPNLQETTDLVTFTEEIVEEKPHFLKAPVIKETSTNFIQSSNKDTTTTYTNLIQIPSLLLLNKYSSSGKTCSNL